MYLGITKNYTSMTAFVVQGHIISFITIKTITISMMVLVVFFLQHDGMF